MEWKPITLNVPSDLIARLRALGVLDFEEFIEGFLNEVDADELYAIIEGEWDDEEDDFDDDEDDLF
ncbi:MAG: hypothetical protein JW910_02430 [Anaerolineae bacterium]|nr:hypothetical protein [Anaerolineae bacterium]